MQVITIEIPNHKTESLICGLADELHLKYTKGNAPSKDYENELFIKKLTKLTQEIGSGSFGDALEYQKKIRKDRKLPYR